MKFLEILFGIATFFIIGAAAIGWIVVFATPSSSSSVPGLLFLTALSAGCILGWRAIEKADAEKRAATAAAAVRVEQREVEKRSLPADWQEPLTRRGFDPEKIAGLIETAYRQGWTRVFPAPDKTFRAFQLTPLSEVRVVILGQDPYPTIGDADGLAFSVTAGRDLPQALRVIFSALEDDPEVKFVRPANGDLQRWAKQGVLLLNAALTIKDGGGSQLDLWEPFTREVLQVIDDQHSSIVVVALGNPAVELASRMRHQQVIEVAHPTAQGATRLPRLKESRAFSRANYILQRDGGGRVDW